MRRDGEHILRKMLRADIPGRRKRGRPKTIWKDAGQRDLKSTGLRAGEETGEGDVEKKDHQLYRRPYMMGKARGKEEEDEPHMGNVIKPIRNTSKFGLAHRLTS